MLNALFIIPGALLYRWRGMAHPKKKYFPRPFNQIFFAFPYAYITWAHYNEITNLYITIALALSVWVVTTLGTLTGHGRGIDVGETDIGEPETLEFLIAWAKPYIPLYYYDIALLSITGLAVTLAAGLLTQNPVVALSGALKGPAYAVAKFGGAKTEGGELLTGACLWGLVFS